MDKLDRSGWTAGFSIHAYGRRIGVRTNDPAVLDRVTDLLPPGSEPCYSPLVDHLFSLRIGPQQPGSRRKNFHLLYGGFTLLARSLDLDEVLRVLESRMHLYLGEFASNRVFVHAGVVGWQGRAILLPGPSGSGKSTLVAELLRAGASYYSDEYAVLDLRGLVHPFPRKLTLRCANRGRSRRCTPEDFGSRAGEEPLPVGLVAFTNYRAGSCWRPKTLTPGQSILALLEHTLSARIDHEGALRVLQQAVAQALLLKGARGEGDDTAAGLLGALEWTTPKETRPCDPKPARTT
jgi:hypothetical protein